MRPGDEVLVARLAAGQRADVCVGAAVDKGEELAPLGELLLEHLALGGPGRREGLDLLQGGELRGAVAHLGGPVLWVAAAVVAGRDLLALEGELGDATSAPLEPGGEGCGFALGCSGAGGLAAMKVAARLARDGPLAAAAEGG